MTGQTVAYPDRYSTQHLIITLDIVLVNTNYVVSSTVCQSSPKKIFLFPKTQDSQMGQGRMFIHFFQKRFPSVVTQRRTGSLVPY